MNNKIKITSEGYLTRYSTSDYSFSVSKASPMGNCKVQTLGGIDVFGYWRGRSDEQKIEALNFILESSYKTVFCTATNLDAVAFLRKYFSLIYCIRVPIGYSGKFQYHILIENTTRANPYRTRLEKEGVRRLPVKLR